MADMELKMAGLKINEGHFQCGFSTLLMSYGPLVVSLVNSFLGLVIDNYLHYRMLRDVENKEKQDIVQEIGENSRSLKDFKLNKLFTFWKKYFSFLTIVLQWIVPILMTLFMYPMEVREMSMREWNYVKI
ncbi:jg17594 [Pararge aegeria aegeria]|uniref:Jg17594 protein n=1 Tax=Pararge aegeria aegeria TaxID=348720 RepID=A0A8S4QQX8_9NEOP|nr:jg17594 [Pararge aegeria aegeria]